MTMELEQKRESYLSSFAAFEKGLNGEARSYVHDIRRRAFDNFLQLGVPSAKLEDWKYTNSSLLNKMPLEPRRRRVDVDVAREALVNARQGVHYANEVVLVDGHFVRELSMLTTLPKGAVVGSLAHGFVSHPACIQRHFAQHVGSGKAFGSLNTAFVLDGLFVYLPKDAVIVDPIHVVVMSTANDESQCRYARMLVVLEPGSQISLIENHVATSNEPYASNYVCEVVLEANARCDHVRVVNQNPSALQVANIVVEQSQHSAYSFHSVTFGGALIRNDVHVALAGRGAECSLFGLDLTKGSQHVDNHTVVEHVQPHCRSSEVFKGIFDDESTGSFCGKVWVSEGAEKTDASQVNRNLLLSKNATVNTRPQLEIYTDDVKCTHGATVGQLDENALFYLRARGIDRHLAQSMLTQAFASEILDSIQMLALRQMLEREVNQWMCPEPLEGQT